MDGRQRDEEAAPPNAVSSPSSARSKSPAGRSMYHALQLTSITSPNLGFGPRSYFSSQSLLDNGQPSYSASPLKIRSQTVALGSLDIVEENQNEDDAPRTQTDPNAPKESGLSLLLKSNTPPETDNNEGDVPVEEDNAKDNSGKDNIVAVDENRNKLQVERESQQPSDQLVQLRPSSHPPSTTSPDHPSYYTLQKADETVPLLFQPYPNYSNNQLDDDDSVLDEYYEQPWPMRWFCAGGPDSYLPHYDDDGEHRREIKITPEVVFREAVIKPLGYIPAVILGLLLNLLDAISYGMITFPIANPIFSTFGPDGISMFFVSCIVSQLVFSLGGSIFGGGNGSMMIEVVPFLHIMAEIIQEEVGVDNPKSIIATTILSYALSSVLTGIVFLLMGVFKLGSLIEFFPRHILVGCIGGVGWFLVQTAIEVSARLEGNLEYNLGSILALFTNGHTFILWFSALFLALLLRVIYAKCQHPLVVPFYFMIVPLVFYAFVYLFRLPWESLREGGWVFPMPVEDAPWYRFYHHYNLKETNWGALMKTIPAMFALTFFGILHVPINVPALGVSINEDNVNTNRELVAHGLSNMFSGFAGSVQNYLVYTNSVLFIKSGGDSRVAGVMLAIATTIVLLIGPWIVGYIPVMVVGALIFHLGLDLMKEALIDTWGIVDRLEYLTIAAIVIAMAALGFVEGIFLGIIMACVFFVLTNSRKSAIRATYSGSSIKSTVRRHYRQQKYLQRVGNQIYAIKLQGYLFFGTINGVEDAIRSVLAYRKWRRNPIRYLIVDFQLVSGLDFSSAEAFIRIQRLLKAKHVYLVLCGATYMSDVGKALRAVGMWDDGNREFLHTFETFYEALEWCENELLRAYYVRPATHVVKPNEREVGLTLPPHTQPKAISEFHSPRQKLVEAAGKITLQDDNMHQQRSTQPIDLLRNALQELTNADDDFYTRLSKYFHRVNVPAGAILWRQGDAPDCMYLVERGSLRATFRVEEGNPARQVESILAGTMAGELGFFANRPRDATLVAEMDCVLWRMADTDYETLITKDPKVANLFIRVSLNFSAERLATMLQHAFHLA
ncbi:10880_t:CDS:10 [Paraglomus brasilianum]|uniref:10880_t:CDS:1 n=1 Tax=Paraglomus brasilianum TaxID=144538 RepID=A0A9N9B8I5_9GLOM|nr:10880_t:CDS:10 [Paraglomus brasilianum]